MSLKNSNDAIGNRTHGLPVCSAVHMDKEITFIFTLFLRVAVCSRSLNMSPERRSNNFLLITILLRVILLASGSYETGISRYGLDLCGSTYVEILISLILR